ncbi:TetR/AcrR family transcriptional regulator [Actinospica durhamensis]|uniref:TetR/AcrR family transcriptional regulator n=1 Tax=Actinospica durhamensis TaxID=1508375 RepID=A0A941EU47_9ACTN|nr:TetR/AcrR family transcriptional regulator [Actinospica durhamensis]MBR7838142.1 TetR/AcrR family transcriptional regulator [Actinospica durhamensis]
MAPPVKAVSSRAVQAEQTRVAILETAERLFAERGYDATSLQMIADEMGLTKAAVYYHFRAKIDILHAAMQPGLRRIEELLEQAAVMRGRRARIEHLVAGTVDFLVLNRHYAVMAAGDPASKQHTLDEDAQTTVLRRRTLALCFGDQPRPEERLAFRAALALTEALPDLVDLSDEELRTALQTTMLRILRVPS